MKGRKRERAEAGEGERKKSGDRRSASFDFFHFHSRAQRRGTGDRVKLADRPRQTDRSLLLRLSKSRFFEGRGRKVDGSRASFAIFLKFAVGFRRSRRERLVFRLKRGGVGDVCFQEFEKRSHLMALLRRIMDGSKILIFAETKRGASLRLCRLSRLHAFERGSELSLCERRVCLRRS